MKSVGDRETPLQKRARMLGSTTRLLKDAHLKIVELIGLSDSYYYRESIREANSNVKKADEIIMNELKFLEEHLKKLEKGRYE